MNIPRRLYVTGGIIVVIAVAAVLWQGYTGRASQSSARLQTITLALDWTPNTDHTGLYVAQAKGWYQKQGINLEILPYSSDVAASALLQSGQASVGIVSTEDSISAQAKNHPLVAIGSIQNNTSGFIVRAGSGIIRPRDLNGKIYGGFGSPIENTIVSTVIKEDGGQGQFKNVTLDVAAMSALESQKIDFVWGYAGWELIQAQRDGIKTNFFPVINYGVPDAPTLSFTVTPQSVAQRAGLLRKFMAATAEGYEYARQHPHESAQLLINEAPKGTFPDTQLVFDSQMYLSAHYASAGAKWGLENTKAWKAYAQFLLNTGNVTNASDKPVATLKVDALFTNQFLP